MSISKYLKPVLIILLSIYNPCSYIAFQLLLDTSRDIEPKTTNAMKAMIPAMTNSFGEKGCQS